MLPELISEAIALAGVYAIGHGVGVHNERHRERELTLDRLMRQQGVKPWRVGERMPGEPMSDEEFQRFMSAIQEARSGD